MQRTVSLGNGLDPLFSAIAGNTIVIREHFPTEIGALPGMMLELHRFHQPRLVCRGGVVVLPVPGVVPHGFWRQIELINVVTSTAGERESVEKKKIGQDLSSFFQTNH